MTDTDLIPFRRLKLEERAWQDISTAPKVNKERVLLAWAGKTHVGYWLDNSASMLPWQGWKTLGMEAWPAGKPTHWQPLPSPPQIMEEVNVE